MDTQNWYQNELLPKLRTYENFCELKETQIFRILNAKDILGFNLVINEASLPCFSRKSFGYSGLKNTFNVLFFATMNKSMDCHFVNKFLQHKHYTFIKKQLSI